MKFCGIEVHEKSEPYRALWHAFFGLVAWYFGQLAGMEPTQIVQTSLWVGSFLLLLEAIRLTWVRRQQKKWKELRGFLGWVHGLPWLRKDEIMQISGVVPFVLSYTLMCLFVPLYAMVLGVMVLAFADPLAREFGVRAPNPGPFQSGKSIEGLIAFMSGAAFALLLTLVGEEYGKRLYSSDESIDADSLPFFLGFAIATIVTSLVEASIPSARERSGWRRIFLDDNFLVPIVFALIYWIFLGGKGVFFGG